MEGVYLEATVARYFCVRSSKVGFIGKNKRIVSITNSHIVECDYADVVKEQVSHSQIVQARILKNGNEVSVVINYGTGIISNVLTYLVNGNATAEEMLAIILRMKDEVANVPVQSFETVQWKKSGKQVPVTLLFSVAYLERVDAQQGSPISSIFVKDIFKIVKCKEDTQTFCIFFRNGANVGEEYSKVHRYQNCKQRDVLVDNLRNTLKNRYSIDLVVEEKTIDEISLEHYITYNRFVDIETTDADVPFVEYPVTKGCNSGRRNDRLLCITRSSILVKHADKGNVLTSNQLSTITRVILHKNDPSGLSIEYMYLGQYHFFVPSREHIALNIISAARTIGNLGAHIYTCDANEEQGAHVGAKFVPTSPQDYEYFIRKLSFLPTSKSFSVVVTKQVPRIIAEFNTNIQPIGIFVKDKKVISTVFEVIKNHSLPDSQGSNTETVAIMVGYLGIFQRLLSSRVAFDEVPQIPACSETLLHLLRSPHVSIKRACLLVIRAITSLQQGDAELTASGIKHELANKTCILQDEVIEFFTALLAEAGNAQGEEDPILTSILLDIIADALHAHRASTSPELATKLMKHLRRPSLLSPLFYLSTSKCHPIVLSSSRILQMILMEYVERPKVLKHLQRQSLTQGALVWQIYLSLSTLLEEQCDLSARLVGLMTDNFVKAQSLIERMIPKEMLEYLENNVG